MSILAMHSGFEHTKNSSFQQLSIQLKK